jgi:hypothetical protein
MNIESGVSLNSKVAHLEGKERSDRAAAAVPIPSDFRDVARLMELFLKDFRLLKTNPEGGKKYNEHNLAVLMCDYLVEISKRTTGFQVTIDDYDLRGSTARSCLEESLNKRSSR